MVWQNRKSGNNLCQAVRIFFSDSVDPDSGSKFTIKHPEAQFLQNESEAFRNPECCHIPTAAIETLWPFLVKHIDMPIWHPSDEKSLGMLLKAQVDMWALSTFFACRAVLHTFDCALQILFELRRTGMLRNVSLEQDRSYDWGYFLENGIPNWNYWGKKGYYALWQLFHYAHIGTFLIILLMVSF